MKRPFAFLMAVALAICSLFFMAEAKPLEKTFDIKSENWVVSVAKFASAAVPIVLTTECREITRRRFAGYSVTRSAGKVPIKALNIKSIERFEPDFVPLN